MKKNKSISHLAEMVKAVKKPVKKTTLKAQPKAKKKALPKANKKAEKNANLIRQGSRLTAHRGIQNANLIPTTPGPPMSDACIEAFQFLTGLSPVKERVQGGVAWSCSKCGKPSPMQCWKCGFVPFFWFRSGETELRNMSP